MSSHFAMCSIQNEALRVEKKPMLILSAESCLRCRKRHYFCLFVCCKLFQFSSTQALFMCTDGFAHVFSHDVRSEGRLPLKLQISLPQFKKLWCSSPLICSKKCLLAYCGLPIRCSQSPSLQFGFKM